MLATKAASSGQHGPPLGRGASRSTSSPSSASPWPPRSTLTASTTAQTSSSAGDDDRERPAGPTGSDSVSTGRPGRAASTRTTAADHPEQEGDPQLGAALEPAGTASDGSCQPQLAQRCRRPACPARSRKVANSSPVRKASAQLLAFSASFHAWRVVHLLEGGDQAVALSASLMPGGATMPRQLVKTRSMPASLASGRRRPRAASSPLVASTRMSPLAIWSLNSPAPEVAKSTLLPRIAGSRSPPPS